MNQFDQMSLDDKHMYEEAALASNEAGRNILIQDVNAIDALDPDAETRIVPAAAVDLAALVPTPHRAELGQIVSAYREDPEWPVPVHTLQSSPQLKSLAKTWEGRVGTEVARAGADPDGEDTKTCE